MKRNQTRTMLCEICRNTRTCEHVMLDTCVNSQTRATAPQKRVNMATPKRHSVAVRTTSMLFGMCLDMEFASIFDFLCVVGGAPLSKRNAWTLCSISAVNFPFGSGSVSPGSKLRTMNTNSAFDEKCGEDDCNPNSEDELSPSKTSGVHCWRFAFTTPWDVCS